MNKHFLGVGIDKYKSIGNRLNGCKEDIKDWCKLLSSELFGFKEIQENIFDEEATTDEIKCGFEKLLKKLQKDKNSIGVFVFSGHGSQRDGSRGERKGDEKDEMIVTYDGFISDDTFRELINRNPFQGKLICIFDSCYSGTIIDSSLEKSGRLSFISEEIKRENVKTINKVPKIKKSKPKKVRRVFEAKNLNEILLAASDESYSAFEYYFKKGKKEKWNGVFTRLAIDAIKSLHSKKTPLTYDKLLETIDKNLNETCEQNPEIDYGCKQNPEFHPQKELIGKEIFN